MKQITYKDSGVNIDEADKFVKLISPIAKSTFRKEVMTDIGFFSGLFKLDTKKYKEPVLISGTDGVGTKLKLAFMADKHDSIGIDLVAMCVNDILTSGAEPLFFLDYLAVGKLQADKAKDIIKGIAVGCKEAGCALLGGETAEMPGFYKENEYELAGFAVGVAEKDKIIDGSKIEQGDVIIGLSSNGLHSNGFSLVRKIFFEIHNYNLDSYIDELNCLLIEELLKPTKIYVKAFNALQDYVEIKAMAHITGGGLVDNIPRVIKNGLTAIIYETTWQRPYIFNLIQKLGNVPEDEMRRTFNLGIGYIIVVKERDCDKTINILKNTAYQSFKIGHIEKAKNTESKIKIL
ncbi:MAG: phosphoribosylformylglycinamidine cyclo-ligase [Thermodesulfovibrionales bacterium]|nr:phosphoribosylformylglycinamidine cyclo-ligase [Thermodesulfovibrionales bacterium]